MINKTNNWMKRTFRFAWVNRRDGLPIDGEAWEDNINTDVDLINYEYGEYEMPVYFKVLTEHDCHAGPEDGCAICSRLGREI